MGILPEALFNFLALLGWSPKDNREFFTKDELINLFDLDNVNKAPAVFDFEKLKWMNEYGKTTQCLRSYILNYFKGEGTASTAKYCGNCSSCVKLGKINLSDFNIASKISFSSGVTDDINFSC